MREVEINCLYKIKNSKIREYLENFTYPWEALKGIGEEIKRIGAGLNPAEFDKIGEDVWIAKSAKVAPTAFIGGPCIICADTEVRHCAFIRGSAFIGESCVVGNSTELKNVILMDKVQVPHYNYVGDSILGYRSHMGAGAITSNIKSDKSFVEISVLGEKLSTGFVKTGAFLGDEVEVGCNSVLNPGTVIGSRSNVYPLSMVRGYVPEKSIYKRRGEVVEKNERA